MTELEILDYLKKIEPYASDYKWINHYKTLILSVEKSCTTESIKTNGLAIAYARKQQILLEQQGLDFKKSNIGIYTIFRLVLSGVSRLLGLKIKGFITINLDTFSSLKELSTIEFNNYMMTVISNYYNSRVVKGYVRPKIYHPICDDCKFKNKLRDKDSGVGCLISTLPSDQTKLSREKTELYNLPILKCTQSIATCPFESTLANNGYLVPFVEHIKPQYLIPKRIYDRIERFIDCLTIDFIKVAKIISENPTISKMVKTHSEAILLKSMNENAITIFTQEYLKFDPAMAIQISKYIEKYGTNQE